MNQDTKNWLVGNASEVAIQTSHIVPSHSHYAEQLFESGLFPDCTVVCGQQRWSLHRAVLAQRCSFFRACFAHSFRESCVGGGGDNGLRRAEVLMNEDDAEAVGRMLKWLYCLEYPTLQGDDTTQSDGGIQQYLPNHFWTSELALFQVADKYDLPTLAQQASTSICDTISQFTTSTKPDTEHTPTSTDKILSKTSLENFTEMLNILYTDLSAISNHVRHLRTNLLRRSAFMIATLLSKGDAQLSSLVTGIPELAGDLVEALRWTVEECRAGAGTCDANSGTLLNNDDDDVSRDNGNEGRRGSGSVGSTSSSPQRGSPVNERGSGSGSGSGRTSPSGKVYIPMNEDSDED